jgi:hypothetical protein
MNTSERSIEGDLARQIVLEESPDRRVLRRLLMIAIVLLVVGLIVFAGFSGIAADPMSGT